MRKTLRELKLHTVCEEARCPNVGECWGGRHRHRDADGRRLHPRLPLLRRRQRHAGPARPAGAAPSRRGGGASWGSITSSSPASIGTTCRTAAPRTSPQAIAELRRAAPKTLVEVLIARLPGLARGAADRSPTPSPRGRAQPRDGAATHARASATGAPPTSSLSTCSTSQARRDAARRAASCSASARPATSWCRPCATLREVGCDILTLGQYLRPSEKHLPVMRVRHAGGVRGPAAGRPAPRLPLRRRGPAGALELQGGRVLHPALGRERRVAMPTWNIIQAVNDALRIEMRRDPRVVVLGEDVGKFGGVFRATAGLYRRVRRRPRHRHAARRGRHHRRRDRHGALRPAAGAGDPVRRLHLPGVRPDRQRAGEVPLPLGRPVPGADGDPHARRRRHQAAATTTRSRPEALFIHTPGLKVVCPSNPYDAKGLLLSRHPRATIRSSSSSRSASTARPRARCPRATTRCRSARRKVVREGRSVTVIALGRHAATRRRGRGEQAPRGLDCELHRPAHALAARHRDGDRAVVKKTGRVVIVHEAPQTCGFGARARRARSQERCFMSLEAPPRASPAWTRRSRTRSRTSTCRSRRGSRWLAARV